MMQDILPLLMAAVLLSPVSGARAQSNKKIPRIGVIHMGGVLGTVADGLRAGLKELGIEDGKQITFDVQDLKGDAIKI